MAILTFNNGTNEVGLRVPSLGSYPEPGDALNPGGDQTTGGAIELDGVLQLVTVLWNGTFVADDISDLRLEGTVEFFAEGIDDEPLATCTYVLAQNG